LKDINLTTLFPEAFMSNYSIRDLERITGIKAHTIRIWEKRYGLISPSRTESNIRLYCDEDVKKLLNVSILLKNGIKISRIAGMSQEELSRKIIEVSVVSNGKESQIENLVVAMIDLDENKFEKTLSQAILRHGFERTLYEIVYPFFERVGILWQAGSINPAQEHFITNLVKQKIYVAIDGLGYAPGPDQKKIVLFLAEWELHEIGMLIFDYFLKKAGLKVFYLGQKVPEVDLMAVCDMVRPDYLLTSFSSSVEKEVLLKYIQRIADNYSEGKLFIAGYQTGLITENLPANVHMIQNSIHFRDEILPSL
jgi:DNA-binding transcriptional MerR regulator